MRIVDDIDVDADCGFQLGRLAAILRGQANSAGASPSSNVQTGAVVRIAEQSVRPTGFGPVP